MSRTERELSTTSYAILGLLAIEPFSTYELARQMRRNLHFFWPSAESHLYAEPKRLVQGGFARAQPQPVGRRPRTVYSITPKGRRALERWLGDPAAESRLESEALVKMMFAPYGSKGDLLAHLRRFLDEQEIRQQQLRDIFQPYLEGADPFPERTHVNVVCARLLWEYAQTATSWASWAIDEVERWADVTGPSDTAALMGVLEAMIAGALDPADQLQPGGS